MRFVVLLFGFLASLITAAIGTLFFFQRPAEQWLRDNEITQLNLLFNTVDKDPALTGFFLYIGAVFCFIGALLGFFRCGWQGGTLMIVSVVGPAILNPMTLLGTGPQIFTAMLSCFVRPLPIMPVSASEED